MSDFSLCLVSGRSINGRSGYVAYRRSAAYLGADYQGLYEFQVKRTGCNDVWHSTLAASLTEAVADYEQAQFAL